MATQIDAAGYALGFNLPASLQHRRKTEEKQSKKLGTFKNIFKNILSESRKAAEEESILEQIKHLTQDNAIVLLQDEVRSAGDALKQRQTIENILLYKQAVKNFIGYVTQEAYAVTTKTVVGRDRHDMLTRKSFTNVVIINEKLDKFAAELVSDQKKQLYVLELLEEIYGLLVDLIT